MSICQATSGESTPSIPFGSFSGMIPPFLMIPILPVASSPWNRAFPKAEHRRIGGSSAAPSDLLSASAPPGRLEPARPHGADAGARAAKTFQADAPPSQDLPKTRGPPGFAFLPCASARISGGARVTRQDKRACPGHEEVYHEQPEREGDAGGIEVPGASRLRHPGRGMGEPPRPTGSEGFFVPPAVYLLQKVKT